MQVLKKRVKEHPPHWLCMVIITSLLSSTLYTLVYYLQYYCMTSIKRASRSLSVTYNLCTDNNNIFLLFLKRHLKFETCSKASLWVLETQQKVTEKGLINILMPFPNLRSSLSRNNTKAHKHTCSWLINARSKDTESAENVLSCKVLSPFKDFLTSGFEQLCLWASVSKSCLQGLDSHTSTHRNTTNIHSKYKEGALRVHWSVWGVGMSKEDVRLFWSFFPGLHKLIPEAGWKETAERNQRKQKMKA